MGEVYRAKDLRLGREVAVKVLPSEVASNPDRLAAFEREARTVAGLNHPNIVTLHSVEDEDGIRFLTMELIEGQTLAALVTSNGLPLDRVLDLSIPMVDALAAAHERGVIHQDLKPGNVMVTSEGRVKILDFGIAMIAAGMAPAQDDSPTVADPSPVPEKRQVLGTVPYMAPEQLRGDVVDVRSDLFALGIILFELATGRKPFTGATPLHVSYAILSGTPDPLTRVRADLPPDLERIVGRCLEKDPRARFQKARDLGDELRALRRALDDGTSGRFATGGVASIAVLPFVNRSRDEEDEYFSDGLADELLNVLAKIKGLRVSARASSFHFKGRDTPLAEVGRALNVATLLDGSVRKAGNRVRISVQLVKVSDGYHLWSETYDRTLEDIFAVQDDIAQSVVRELRVKLLGEEAASDASVNTKAEVARAARGRGSNAEAHRRYLLARHLIDRWTRDDTAKAIEYLEAALALDPVFPLAWTELSRAHAREASRGWAPANEAFRRAREAAERALALEPDLAEGHARIGWIRLSHDSDWRGAEASFTRALELAPGNAVVLGSAGVLARSLGRIEEAIAHCREAVEQDPLSSPSFNNLGLALHTADRLTEAETAYRKALELAPQRSRTRSLLALTLAAQGRREEALAEAVQEPENVYRLYALAIVHGAKGEESKAALRQLIEAHSADSAYQIAEVHAARGESNEAFDWLERAYVQRDGGLVEMRASPHLRSLHADPRWEDILKKAGLEESADHTRRIPGRLAP